MIDEWAEMQLKQLLTKALDEAFAQGLESGKRTGFESGRRAGIEESIQSLQGAVEPLDCLHYQRELDTLNEAIDELRSILEAK